jgi:hypothetical protein
MKHIAEAVNEAYLEILEANPHISRGMPPLAPMAGIIASLRRGCPALRVSLGLLTKPHIAAIANPLPPMQHAFVGKRAVENTLSQREARMK